MKTLYFVISCVLLLAACANQEQNPVQQTDKPALIENRQAAEPVLTETVRNDEQQVSAGANKVKAVSAPSGRAEVQPVPGVPASSKQEERAAAREARRMMVMDSLQAPQVAVPAPVIGNYQPYVQEREQYGVIVENGIKQVAQEPVSTFSIDVDTGSYANVRRMLNAGRLPPADAVRVEEMINYFPYNYPLPKGNAPFAVHTEIAPAPWNASRLLLRIGIKGQDVAKESLPAANLVFLVDVSGSMNSPERLSLLKSALKLLVNQLRAQDRVSLVTYASGTQVVLEPTSGSNKARIIAALDNLRAGGSTAGAAGINLAYSMAQQGYIKGGINRILLATDGDFNVGITSFEALKNLAAEKRKSGVSLSTLGFGVGNYNEKLMEQLADAGNGNYSYIDTLNEGQKVLVNEMTSTLATIAKDVKIQIEFNPAVVSEYRLIGYENRMLQREDFNNDKVDAGEVGAGHTVTALYELNLRGNRGSVDPLRYGKEKPVVINDASELAFLRLRYKEPDGEVSKLVEWPLHREQVQSSFERASGEFRFAAAVAGFGQLLRGGKYSGAMDYAGVARIAAEARGADSFGYRGEFLRLVKLAESLATGMPATGVME